MEPINGKEEWEKTTYTQPLPPNVKPSTGRPKVKRNRKNDILAPPPADATKLKRRKTTVQCSKCKVWGHNRRTCTGNANANEGNQDAGIGMDSNQANEGEGMASNAATEGGGMGSQADGREQGGQNISAGQNNEGDVIPHEFVPGASQPATEGNDSQGGVFNSPPPNPEPSSCGVAPKPWQQKKKTVTTRAEILRARSSRPKKQNPKYVA